MVGKKIMLPLIGREIPIIADAAVDPAFGSGAVKITPGHDFNDFQIGRRHNLAADFRDGYAWADERRGRPVSRDDARGMPQQGGRGPRRRWVCWRRWSRISMRSASARAARRWSSRCSPISGSCASSRSADEGACGGARRPHDVPSEALGEHLFQLDGERLRLVHLAPTMVGPSHPRVLVRAMRRDDGRGRAPGDMHQVRRQRSAPGRGRARHLVQLGAVAVFDPGMARARRPSSSAIIRPACSSPASTSFFSGSRG